MKQYLVFAGSIQQETNSFSPVTPTLTDFERLEGNSAHLKLAVEPLHRPDVDLVVGTYAHAVPSGILPKKVYLQLLDDLLRSIPAMPNGVFLYLHGALEVEEIGSGDADIVRAVRAQVGNDTKIAVAMDFHANVSPLLIQHADAVCAYRTAPHTDMEDTQRRACSLLLDMLVRAYRPAACLVHIPMLFTGDRVITRNEPACGLMHSLEQIINEDNLYSLEFCFGQAWVDTPWVGPSVIAYADTEETAIRSAQKLARMWWDARDRFQFLVQACLPSEAMNRVAESPQRPVFLSDSGDNVTAGAPGDRAGILVNAVGNGNLHVLIAGITDEFAVRKAWDIGVGSRVHFSIGGTLDVRHNDVCSEEFQVIGLGIMLGWYGEAAGKRALLRHGNLDVIVTEQRCAVISPEIIRSGGAEPFEYDAVVVKLGYLYPALAEIAPRAVYVLTEGISTARIETIPFKRVPAGMYPVEENAQFTCRPSYVKEVQK